VEEETRRLADKKGNMEEMAESDGELHSMLENFEQQMRDKAKRQKDMQHEIDMLTGEMATLRSEMDALNTQRGEATATRDQVQCHVVVVTTRPHVHSTFLNRALPTFLPFFAPSVSR
jgi:Tfp pilus assembly protein FimV